MIHRQSVRRKYKYHISSVATSRGKEDASIDADARTTPPFCPQHEDAGVSLEEACRTLRKQYHSEDRAWANYGDHDRLQFEPQCKAFNVRYPFGKTHFNVKALFALARGLPREVGMDEALRLMNLPLEGTHHRGGDDARNIAKILSSLLSAARR